MGNHQDGNIFPGVELFQHAQDPVTAAGIQACGRFIQNQDRRLHGQDAGNGNTAHLAAGQLKGAAFGIFLIIQMNAFHGITNPLINFGSGQSLVFRAESDILRNGLLKKLIFRILENQADPLTQGTTIDMLTVQVLTVNQNLAGGGLEQAVEMLYEGRFTAAGMADDPDKFSVFDPERNIIQGYRP